MGQQVATFRIRKGRMLTDLHLITKKKAEQITNQNVADALNESLSREKLLFFACDIEELKTLEDLKEIQDAFNQINNLNKHYI